MTYESLLENAGINDYSGKDIILAHFRYLIQTENQVISTY